MATLSRLAQVSTAEVKGLAGKRSAALLKAGIENVADLLHHVPRRYIDRSLEVPISQILLGAEVTVVGQVTSVSTRRPRRNLAIIEAFIADESGSIKAVWFNQTFRARQLTKGAQVAWSGVVESFR